MITSKEFQGLARGKLRGKMQTKAPDIKKPRNKSSSKTPRAKSMPTGYPQRRSNIAYM